jgi:hypothetical protein
LLQHVDADESEEFRMFLAGHGVRKTRIVPRQAGDAVGGADARSKGLKRRDLWGTSLVRTPTKWEQFQNGLPFDRVDNASTMSGQFVDGW